MSDSIKKEKSSNDDSDKDPRVKGAGNPDSHSQDADRHRKIQHQKSDK